LKRSFPKFLSIDSLWLAVQHLDQSALARTKEVERNERGGRGFRYIVETNYAGAEGFVESVALLEDLDRLPFDLERDRVDSTPSITTVSSAFRSIFAGSSIAFLPSHVTDIIVTNCTLPWICHFGLYLGAKRSGTTSA
jgi:hypothetical protein